MEIKNWLTGEREYWSGVKLLKKHIPGGFIVGMLSAGKDPYNEEKLAELLTGLAREEEEKTKEIPADVTAIKERATDYMDERAALKAQLRVLPRAEERKKAAFRILDISDELNDLFRQLDFFDRFGHLPLPDALPDDPLELTRRRNNLRTYLSRAKKAKDPDKEKAIRKELDLVERKLKTHE